MESPSPYESEDPLRKYFRRLLYTLPYLLILYVLSTGPMYWRIYDAYYMEGSMAVYVFYYPLILASEVPFIDQFFRWYLSFWI